MRYVGIKTYNKDLNNIPDIAIQITVELYEQGIWKYQIIGVCTTCTCTLFIWNVETIINIFSQALDQNLYS